MSEKLNLRTAKNKKYGFLAFEVNIADFPTERVQSDDFPIQLQATNQFGHTLDITIQDNLQFTEGDNSKTFGIQDFYEKVYGIDTQIGKDRAFDFESSLHGSIQLEQDDLLTKTSELPAVHFPFRFDYAFQNIRIKWFEELDTLQYHSISPSGHSVATKDYSIVDNSVYWDTQGVFRVHKNLFNNDQDFVLIVDNPCIEDFLNSRGIPALSLPSDDEILNYNFNRILKGKNIYFCLDQYGFPFSHSLYPFASYLLMNEVQVQITDTKSAFDNEYLPNFVHQQGIDGFKKKLENNSSDLFPSVIPSSVGFNEQFIENKLKEFHPVQDFKNNSVIYSIDKGHVYFSNPKRILKTLHVEHMEALTPTFNEELDVDFTSQMLRRIENRDNLTPIELYNKLNNFLKRFIHFRVKEYFTILTLWIMGTYVYRIFKAYPYLHLQGERGTGKSTILELVSKLSFQGFFLTKATISTLTEQAHFYGSTLCIDEFEDYSGSRKTHDELSKFLNGGYNYLGSYTKRNQGISTTYSTYTPKVFGGTGTINIDTLQSRTIPFKTFKKPESVHKQQFLEFDPANLVTINSITTSGYALGIQFGKELYRQSFEHFEDVAFPLSKNSLNNRQLELARPLLTIANLIDDEDILSTLLLGLDKCWNTNETYTNERDKELEVLLQNFVDDTKPTKTKGDQYSDYFIFGAVYLLEYEPVKEFKTSEDLGKINFNKRIKDLAKITVENIYIPELQKKISCYLFPKNKFR